MKHLKKKYKPKKVYCVKLAEPYASNSALLNEAFEKLGRSIKQADTLMALIQLSKQFEYVKRAELIKKTNVKFSLSSVLSIK